jgi:hypothetical protein
MRGKLYSFAFGALRCVEYNIPRLNICRYAAAGNKQQHGYNKQNEFFHIPSF